VIGLSILAVISLPPLWQTLLLAAAAGMAVFLLVRGDSRKEDRRRVAIAISEFFAKWGFTRSANIATAYAVGDYSGLLRGLRNLKEAIDTPEERLAIVNSLWTAQVTNRLADKTLTEDMIADFKRRGWELKPLTEAPPQSVGAAAAVAATTK
jgi:hypothetical protein